MLPYLLRRFLLALPVIFGVSTITFFLIHLVPGDPVDIMLGDQAHVIDREALRRDLNLDLPLAEQYGKFLSNLVKGELGRSLYSRRPVVQDIVERIPATAELTIFALGVAVTLGIFLGGIAAVKESTWVDRAANIYGLLAVSIPGFFLGPMLILIFSIYLDWFPISERTGFSSVVLPGISLALALGAVIFRMTRASMLEVLREDYVRFAKAKGLDRIRVHFKHALRNACMPIITVVGLQFGALMTGTVITETIFDWPGIGTLFYQAVQQRNYPLVQGCVLFISLTYVTVNILTDLTYAWANPKVRL